MIPFEGHLIAQNGNKISGTVRDDDRREAIPLVNVVIKGSSFGAATDNSGRYNLRSIPPGEYTLVASAVGFKSKEVSIRVDVNSELITDFLLEHSVVELGEVLVYGASLRRERITEAPAAISLVEGKDIALSAGHGQLPKLLESQPGVDIVQSGLYDFNVNTRGFNSSLNRRLLILLDGRDLGTAFLGATEWNGLSVPLEELGRIELVRGPGSALYGANAYNGVMNITSIPPRANLGTKVILGGGDPTSFRADARHSGAIDESWSYKVNLGGYTGKTFSRTRKGYTVEYPGFDPLTNRMDWDPIVNIEAIDLNTDPVRSVYGSARVDYEYQGGGAATVEAGVAQVENEVIVTGIGRVQVQKAQRPWARLSYANHGLSLLAWTNARKNVEPELSLSTGLPLYQDAVITHTEAQYQFNTFENSLLIVAGVSHRLVDIGTKGTLMQGTRHDDATGVFAQAEFRYTNELKFVLAARLDRSSLHESFVSPKAAVVWSPSNNHSIRLTFNQAFQAPNYSELYLYVKHPTRPLAYFGNPSLKVEKIAGYEIGYKGIFSNSLFVTLDVYFNQLKDFITDLGPGVNPAYPGPIILPGESASRTIWSYSNAGVVDENGFEISTNYYISDSWNITANVSYFNFKIVEGHPLDPTNQFLVPNSPRYRLNTAATYTAPGGLVLNLDVRYVPKFRWAAGIFKGNIPAYSVVNLAASYPISSSLSGNLSLSNVLNRQHYQIFGGSILGRRSVLTAAYSF